MTVLIASQVLSWIMIVCLLGAVFALARQVGILHERMPSVGALVTDKGPEVGEPAPAMELVTAQGSSLMLGRAREQAMLLLFISASCPICKQLLPWVGTFARQEQVELVLLGDSETPDDEARLRSVAGQEFAFVREANLLGMAFQIGKLPYAVLLNANGTIAAKGLVNSREHLESLINAGESDTASLQDYLAKKRSAANVA